MTDFALFEKALAEYKITKNQNEDINNKSNCKHTDIVKENGITSCLECGELI